MKNNQNKILIKIYLCREKLVLTRAQKNCVSAFDKVNILYKKKKKMQSSLYAKL